MITVRLKGGLGNQMFQYAAARRLSLMHSTKVCLDISWYKNHINGSFRPFELKNLAIQAPAIFRSYNIGGLSTQQATRWVGERLQSWGLRLPRIYVEPHFEFSETILNLPDHTILSGYFESARNFGDIANHIRCEFRPRNDKLIEEIQAAVKAVRRPHRALVAVHVRRGDLRFIDKGRRLLPLDRILEAMGRFSGCDFLVFSDELDWCRMFIKGPNVIYSSFSTAIEDLFAMSVCDHQVIGPSTFAWWAAWLNLNPQKIVVEYDIEGATAYDAFPEGHWRC